MGQYVHVEITLVKGLWLSSGGNASGPAGLGVKLIKYEVYISFFALQQKLLVFSLNFKDIITVTQALIIFSRIA